jgi:uncharacterized protein
MREDFHPEKLYFNFLDVVEMTNSVVKQLKGKKFDYIVGISRGGLVPAVMISHRLNLPLRPVVWSTRDHKQQVHDTTIIDDLRAGARFLLVDDINDSGETFSQLLADWGYPNADLPGTITTASLHQRQTTSHPSDVYAALLETDAWVCYPWEHSCKLPGV